MNKQSQVKNCRIALPLLVGMLFSLDALAASKSASSHIDIALQLTVPTMLKLHRSDGGELSGIHRADFKYDPVARKFIFPTAGASTDYFWLYLTIESNYPKEQKMAFSLPSKAELTCGTHTLPLLVALNDRNLNDGPYSFSLVRAETLKGKNVYHGFKITVNPVTRSDEHPVACKYTGSVTINIGLEP